ncbi:MAG: alkaline-phosphatase-like protein [Benjaminiella poitrasii]|nr:MAG: alkaline-phosphatase-like protein [Benjaminiella poitrasii]
MYSSQIKQGVAYPFTAKATTPTVTLPRIKALTTGTIPSFLDAILNIAESDTSSSLENHDNWVYQFKHNNNKTIHFFGDDTWMRLFPDLFDKTDGTTSFFVSDTTEVDLNVTRHINSDLPQDDWNAVILHYLGLDHIGHLGGPESPLMKPKQKEMDQAIESIYDIVSKQDSERIKTDSNAKGTLIVVCGDHGMNEKGNHGGSSIGETSAALVFLSPRYESRPSKYQKPLWDLERSTTLGFPIVDQIDLVPTLATLFSFPIPKNNLGKMILELYKPHQQDLSHVLRGLQLNAVQLGRLFTKLVPEIADYIDKPHVYADEAKDDNFPGFYYAKAVKLHQLYIQAISSNEKEETGKEAIALYYKDKMYPVCLSLAQLVLIRVAMAWNHSTLFGNMLQTYSGLQWHLMAITLLTTVISGLRLLFKLNDKLQIDVNQTAKIIQTIVKAALALIIFLTSVLVLVYKMKNNVSEDLPNLYKPLLDWELVQPLDQIQLGRLVFNYGGAGLFVLYGLFYVSKRAAKMNIGEQEPVEYKTRLILELLLHVTTPLLILLSGTHNAFLYCLFNVQFQLLMLWQDYLADKSPVPVWLIGVITVFLSHASFFLTGHHNSMASVDLSNAYVGVQTYDTVLIGLLTFMSNWSGSIWWAIAGWVLMANVDKKEAPQAWSTYLVTHSVVFSFALSFLSISTTILREHLFIWTVFSPKYLYQVAWTCLFHWLTQVSLGSLFTQIIFKWNYVNRDEDSIEADERSSDVE